MRYIAIFSLTGLFAILGMTAVSLIRKEMPLWLLVLCCGLQYIGFAEKITVHRFLKAINSKEIFCCFDHLICMKN